MLTPPSEGISERILTIGGFGSGKTTAWLSIALWAQRTKSPAQFYVIDTDASVSHMMSTPTSRYAELTNVHVWSCSSWSQIDAALAEIRTKVKPGLDWVVVDFISSVWDAAIEFYVEEFFKLGWAEFFVSQRKRGKENSPLDGWKDWSVINAVYRKWMEGLIHKTGAHIFLTAPAEQVRDTDAKELRHVFGSHGFRPKGQKHLAYQVHSVLLLGQQPVSRTESQWTITTVKDRERPELVEAQLGDFTRDYLMGVAGWKL